jgi:hypothetical protein
MAVVLVVVGEPLVQLSEHRGGVRQRVDANVVALNEASARPLLSGLATGRALVPQADRHPEAAVDGRPRHRRCLDRGPRRAT